MKKQEKKLNVLSHLILHHHQQRHQYQHHYFQPLPSHCKRHFPILTPSLCPPGGSVHRPAPANIIIPSQLIKASHIPGLPLCYSGWLLLVSRMIWPAESVFAPEHHWNIFNIPPFVIHSRHLVCFPQPGSLHLVLVLLSFFSARLRYGTMSQLEYTFFLCYHERTFAHLYHKQWTGKKNELIFGYAANKIDSHWEELKTWCLSQIN